MFRKKEDEFGNTLDETYAKIEDINFYVSYFLATEFPDTEIGSLMIENSEYLKKDFRDKMKENLDIFTDEKYSALDRTEKINLFKKRIE
jgi:CRISPR/Cas system CMR-associated protein Cmr3 (group 5 of RAMP superfamily)